MTYSYSCFRNLALIWDMLTKAMDDTSKHHAALKNKLLVQHSNCSSWIENDASWSQLKMVTFNIDATYLYLLNKKDRIRIGKIRY